MPLLPVSHCRQHPQSEGLAACAVMALGFLQNSADSDSLVTLLEIEEAGAPFRNLRFLKPLGVTVLIEQGELDTLRRHLERSLPPIAFVRTDQLSYWGEATGHAVVVVGIDGDWIFLNDPNFADAPKRVALAEFELAWIELDQFYALVSLG